MLGGTNHFRQSGHAPATGSPVLVVTSVKSLSLVYTVLSIVYTADHPESWIVRDRSGKHLFMNHSTIAIFDTPSLSMYTKNPWKGLDTESSAS